MLFSERMFADLCTKMAQECHELSVRKGFYNCLSCDGKGNNEGHPCASCGGTGRIEPSFEQRSILIVTEIAEAYEEYRATGNLTKIYEGKDGKPEGVPIELADAMIRIMDFCAWKGIDIGAAIVQKHKYNETRPYRHGGKLT